MNTEKSLSYLSNIHNFKSLLVIPDYLMTMLNVCNQAIWSEPSTCHTSGYQVTILDMQPTMIQWTHMTLYEAVRALFRWSPLLVIPSRCIVIIYTRDIAHKEHNFQLRVSYPYTTLIYFSKPTTETPDMSRPSISIIYIVSAKLVHGQHSYIGQCSLALFKNYCFDFN